MNKLIKALRRIVADAKAEQEPGVDSEEYMHGYADGLAAAATIAQNALDSLPGRGKSRVHDIVVKARFDNALTAKEARYAVWNHVHELDLWGDGKPDRYDRDAGIRSAEPYGQGEITVRR